MRSYQMSRTEITTAKAVYPQIYAYTLPTVTDKQGWVKIGYTEKSSVHTRIKEQVRTVDLSYDLLWSEIAKLHNDEYFTDHQLHSYLRRHKNIENKKGEHRRTEWFFYNGTPQKSLQDFYDFVSANYSQENNSSEYELRQEQLDAVNKTLAYFKDNPNGEFLWNAKPRFGKTLTTYDLACKLNAKKVLIVTNRPAIANSWFDDFEKFIAWQTDFAFVSTSDSLKERPVLNREQFLDQMTKPNGKKSMIAFISLQDLKGSIHFGGQFDKLDWVKKLTWDLLVIDEAHEGVDTLKTDVAFDNISRDFTLHLSGTPFKALAGGQFSQDEIYNWTYADEQSAKLNWADDEDSNPYATLPTLNLFSYQMSRMISDKVNQGADIGGDNIDFAFDLNEFFATDDKGNFIHKKEVEKWLNTLSQNEKYPFSTKELRDEIKHSFWLLNRVDGAKALAKLLKNHPVFENYHIVLAVGDGRGDDNDMISGKALNRVKQAIKENDKTITLSVGQLTTGVTIPEWTAVLMLSNLKSPALYMQTAFRAQNAWRYEKDGQFYQKKNAYVFDFAPERTLTIYDEFANNLSLKTSNGNGTTDERENNIKELLNFFPVIAEDSEGKMVELDVNQVLTIPKVFKATEVVKRGFMSNLLFQNISGIFSAQSDEVREIIEQFEYYDNGKINKEKTNTPIDTQGVQVDSDGNAVVDNEIVINTNNARFGEKLYAAIETQTQDIIQNNELNSENLANKLTNIITQSTQSAFKELAKENGLTEKFADKVVKEQSQEIAYEVNKLQEQNKIEQNTAKIHFENKLKNAKTESEKQQIKSDYEIKKQVINQDLQHKISETVNEKVAQLTQNSTETILQKAEQNKQNKVEDDVRGRLRGFSRTIPSFLMAYGDKNTTLANFDSHISDAVFKEVTGITLEQFRVLRDKHHFFDEQVFDNAVQEFLNKRFALADYFDEHQTEDIFDYIPPQRTNQIFTPKKVVKMMMDKFEEENPDIFSNPNLKFADLYMKSGLYITEIVKRLYVGLESEFPNPKERLKYIFANQVYGFAPSEIIYNIAKNFILGFDEMENIDPKINVSHIVQLDTTPYAKGELNFNDKLTEIFGKAMKFDVIVGNPPYQDENIGDNNQAVPVYHYFYELSEKMSNKYCLISPARFLSNQGATPKSWNSKMLNDEHVSVLYFNPKSDEVFLNTDIKGGVVVIYRDVNKNFGSIDTFIAFDELRNIFKKVRKTSKETISHLVYSPDSYRFTDDVFVENPNLIGRTDKSHAKAVSSSVFTRYPEIFFEKQPNNREDYVQIYGRLNNERIYFWVKRKYIANHPNLDRWKVFVTGANGTGAFGEILSTPVIGKPFIGHNQTFVSLGNFKTEFESQALLKYIKSKFGRAMLGIMKTTQNNQSKNTWSKVPLQDFTADSDIDWSKSIREIDKQLYAKYGLSDEEIDFIESKVREMS